MERENSPPPKRRKEESPLPEREDKKAENPSVEGIPSTGEREVDIDSVVFDENFKDDGKIAPVVDEDDYGLPKFDDNLGELPSASELPAGESQQGGQIVQENSNNQVPEAQVTPNCATENTTQQ